jgi:lysozyme
VDDLSYTYAAGTNRLSALADAAGVSAESWDAEAGSFSYDVNGRLLSSPDGLSGLTYTPDDRVETLTRGGVTTRYRFDADGHRITARVGSGDVRVYVKDGPTTLAVFTGPDGATPTAWDWHLVAEDVVIGRQPQTGNRRFYHRDLLGSVRAVVTGTTILESRDYDPWGVVLEGRTLGSGTREGFTGHERDPESGLDHTWARAYQATVARWGRPDPVRDSFPEWGPYAYVENDPVSATDPLGLCPLCGAASQTVNAALTCGRSRPCVVSQRGVDFIAAHEGFSATRYNDPAGFPTIGYGHLITRRDVVREPLSLEQGRDLLATDMRDRAEPGLRRVSVPLFQWQADALGSFVFNVGSGNFARSTLLRELNSGNYAAVAGELNRWVNAGGRALAGLVSRRAAEGRLFTTGRYR